MAESEADIELSTVKSEESDYDDEETLMESESIFDLSKFDWVESKRYWYTLINILIVIVGVTTIILLGISAPGLWKFFNHDTICDEQNGYHYELPSNPFTFSDMMSLSPKYPTIHWISTDLGFYYHFLYKIIIQQHKLKEFVLFGT